MREGAREQVRRHLLHVVPGARGRPPVALPLEDPPANAWPNGAAVLALRPDHIGDVLLAGPGLDQLRAHRPDLDLALWVGPWSEEVARRLPAPSRVEAVRASPFDRAPNARRPPWRPYTRLLAAARRIAAGGFAAALVLRDDDWWSAWAASLAGVPQIIGHDNPNLRPFLTHALGPAPGSTGSEHVAAAGLRLALAACGGRPAAMTGPRLDGSFAGLPHGHHPGAPAGPSAVSPASDAAVLSESSPLRLALSPRDLATAEKLLGELRDAVAIHPGSGSPIKRWPDWRWAEVACAVSEPGETIVLTGSAAEGALTAGLSERLHAAGRRALDLAGRTDIGALAGVYAVCRLVLGPDSGPLHLAVAAGTPTVHLFGPADACRFGPWGPPDRHRALTSGLPCAPCGRLDWPDPAAHPCVRTIDVREVAEAATAVLARLG